MGDDAVYAPYLHNSLFAQIFCSSIAECVLAGALKKLFFVVVCCFSFLCQ